MDIKSKAYELEVIEDRNNCKRMYPNCVLVCKFDKPKIKDTDKDNKTERPCLLIV